MSHPSSRLEGEPSKGAVQSATAFRELRIAPARVMNMFCNYLSSDDEDADLVKNTILEYKAGLYDFGPDDDNPTVPFLIKSEDEDFEYLRQFRKIGLKAAAKIEDYLVDNWGKSVIQDPKNLKKLIVENEEDRIKESNMDFIQNNVGVFSYIGHAGYWIPNEDWAHMLVFPLNSLFAYKDTDWRCNILRPGNDHVTPNSCFDYNCVANKYRSSNSLDDVLLAVLIGCNTGRKKAPGMPTVAEQMEEQGVDCIVSIQGLCPIIVMNFLYYNFYEELFENNNTINQAMINAFETTWNQIIAFFTVLPDDAGLTFKDVQEQFGPEPDNESGFLYEARNYMIKIKVNEKTTEKVADKDIWPARFGARQN